MEQYIPAKMRFVTAHRAKRHGPVKMSKLHTRTATVIGAFVILAAPILLTAAVAAADGDWVAELRGPVQRCQVPQRILFIADDAIINGQITFQGKTYYPRGRLEDTLESEFALVTRYGDPKPLVSITGKANGRWGGEWVAGRKGCKGAARISQR
jgi:hypothetical protein